MFSPRSPILDQVVENVVKRALGENNGQPEKQETVLVEQMREKVEVEAREDRVLFSDGGAKNFKEILAKKGIIGERGFNEIMSPFEEEIERRGWGKICKHPGEGRIVLVREFYANLEDRKNLTCYVRGKWVPFGERTISQLFELKEVGDCSEHEELEKNPNLEKIANKVTRGRGEWQSTLTIPHAYLYKGNLTKVSKVWFYFLNSVMKPSKHVSIVRQDRALLLYALV